MAKVNQNKLIGALVVAIITLVVVIIIVVIAQRLFPSNSRNTSSTLLGTDTNKVYTAATTTTSVTKAPEGNNPDVTAPELPNDDPDVVVTTPSEQTGTIVYLKSSVYLRSEASWHGVKGSVISKGASATVVSVEGDWYRLEYNGEQGYVAKDYVQSEPLSEAPEAPAA